MKLAPGGKEQCGNHVVPRREMEQQRNKADLRSWKLAVRTGGEKEIGERNGKTPLRKRKLLLCPTNEEWYAGKALR
ncbi:MAG: hypothetical protein DMG38_22930 [Acidobacteria bacterium]|nr:MAG: hypothetical protein DMG38_22930 [Acidobacteriota bacterium]